MGLSPVQLCRPTLRAWSGIATPLLPLGVRNISLLCGPLMSFCYQMGLYHTQVRGFHRINNEFCSGDDKISVPIQSPLPKKRISCVVTMATMECDTELLLFLTSLRTFHPTDLTIIIGCTSEMTRRSLSGLAASPSNVCSVAFLRFSNDPHVEWIPCLDKYIDHRTVANNKEGKFKKCKSILQRKYMENTAGIWYRTIHDDFMMEKSNLMEHALLKQLSLQKRESFTSSYPSKNSPSAQCGVLFLDCDIVTLGPLPEIPHSCVLGVSRHYIRKEDELMFGSYNGGWVYMNDPSLIQVWRQATFNSRYYDQASLEDVADHVLQIEEGANKKDSTGGCSVTEVLYEFPIQCNFGYWRMFQAPETNIQLKERFHKEYGTREVLNEESLHVCLLHHQLNDRSTSNGCHSLGTDESTMSSCRNNYGSLLDRSISSTISIINRFSIGISPATKLASSDSKAFIQFDGIPLQSIHTHMLASHISSSSRTMSVFNQLIQRWMEECVKMYHVHQSMESVHPYKDILHVLKWHHED